MFPAGSNALIAWAPAKINLHLEVPAKRPDGYHAIETLMLAVDLFDTIEFRDNPIGTITLECEAPGVPDGPSNLVYRIAHDLQSNYAPTRGVSMRLTKRIPHEAGLGGGSSDGATTILVLNRLWNLNLRREQMLETAARHGSDIGFFLTPPAGWCRGRGEIVEPETIGETLNFVLVKPAVGASTAEIYRRFSPPNEVRNGTAIRQALRQADVTQLGRLLHNRLQAVVFHLLPEIAAVHRRLTECNPEACLMSGSGSAIFGLARSREHAMSVANEYRAAEQRDAVQPGSQVFVVRSFPSQPR